MNDILTFIVENQKQVLDITGALLGIIYILLEYRASIWLWPVSIVMPLVDMMLYFEAGLYADFAMAIYYALAAVYGFLVWRYGWKFRLKKNGQAAASNQSFQSNQSINSTETTADEASKNLPITHFPLRKIAPATLIFAVLWIAIWYLLSHFTNSTVPVRDSFTTALSMIALWALARKYVEQWLMWLVVDLISFWLYFEKGIPFKGMLYAFYCFMAVAGYLRWRKMAREARLTA